MNITQQGVITLLKSAVLQKPLPLPVEFDIERAVEQVKKHHMTALLYEGAILCGVSGQLPIMQRLFRDYCKSVIVNERQMRQLYSILAAFDANGIDYMMLKGSKMKALYPKPELRAMGDADILIRMEQYDRIKPLMENMGMREGSVTDHELHWYQQSLMVELHSKLIPSYNKDFYAYFGDGWFLAQKGQGSQYSMNAEDEMVYLFTHFAKHYRDGGIGCRHVLDLWVFLRSNPHINEEKVMGELEKLQLREFYENIRRIIDVWFADKVSDKKTDFISDFIFASGSWGTSESRTASIAVRDQSHQKGSFRARVVYFLRYAFPTVNVLQEKYRILKRAPWMLPLVWIYRPFYKLLWKEERGDISRHAKNLKDINPDNLQTRQQALQYVGLDYNF